MPCDDCSRAENCPPCVHAPGGHYARRPKVCACGHSRLDHMGGADEAACEVFGCLCTQITEPKGSASSSPDERYLKCGSCGIRHAPEGYCLTEPDAAQEAAMQELTDLRQEMEAEAPECKYPGGCPLESGLCPADKGCAFVMQMEGIAMMPRSEPEAPECKMPQGCDKVVPCDPGCAASSRQLHEQLARAAEPPRRPPYAVAYTLASGEQYEVALPGDATVRAHEGALVITHASAVQALIQTRPMEGA